MGCDPLAGLSEIAAVQRGLRFCAPPVSGSRRGAARPIVAFMHQHAPLTHACLAAQHWSADIRMCAAVTKTKSGAGKLPSTAVLVS